MNQTAANPYAAPAAKVDDVSRNPEAEAIRKAHISHEASIKAVGALYYSREIPSLLRGVRLSKLYGRDGIITFESNGGFVLVRGRRGTRLHFPGFRDIRGYRAMYRDFLASVRTGRTPEMSLERAVEDQRLMDQIYAGLPQ